jgi:hypothetical protein
VADLAAEPEPARHEPPVDQDPAADPRPHSGEDQGARSAAGAIPVLAQRGGVCVVLDRHRQLEPLA